VGWVCVVGGGGVPRTRDVSRTPPRRRSPERKAAREPRVPRKYVQRRRHRYCLAEDVGSSLWPLFLARAIMLARSLRIRLTCSPYQCEPIATPIAVYPCAVDVMNPCTTRGFSVIRSSSAEIVNSGLSLESRIAAVVIVYGVL